MPAETQSDSQSVETVQSESSAANVSSTQADSALVSAPAATTDAPPFPTFAQPATAAEAVRNAAPQRATYFKTAQEIAEVAQEVLSSSAYSGTSSSTGQRKPVTSLNPDLARYPFGKPPASKETKPGPVEF
jgi:hypothetical protein